MLLHRNSVVIVIFFLSNGGLRKAHTQKLLLDRKPNEKSYYWKEKQNSASTSSQSRNIKNEGCRCPVQRNWLLSWQTRIGLIIPLAKCVSLGRN